MSNNLQVVVSADAASLLEEFAKARASASSFSAELNKLAKASNQGILDSAGQARMHEVAAQLAQARGETAALSDQLQTSGAAFSRFGSQAEGSGRGTATAAREIHRLFDELKSGSTGGADVTMLRLAAHFLDLGPAALVGVGAVGALAAGLGFLASRAIEAHHALDQMQIGAKVAGNLSLTREDLEQYTESLARASNVSAAEAQRIVASFARIPGMTASYLQTATNLVSRFALATGVSSEKAAEEIARIFKAPSAGAAVSMLTELNVQISSLQQNAARSADAIGTLDAQARAKFELIHEAASRANAEEAQEAASWSASWGNKLSIIGSYLAESEGVETAEEAQAARIAEQTALYVQQDAQIKRNNADRAAQANSPEQNIQVGLQITDKEPPITAQLRSAQAEAQQLTKALGDAQAKLADMKLGGFDPAVIKEAANNVADFGAELTQSREKMNALQFGPVLERMRADMQQLASTWDGTQEGLLAKQKQIEAAALAETQKGSKEYLAIKTEMATTEVALRKAASGDIVETARSEVAAIAADTRRSAVERLSAEQDLWRQTLSQLRAGSSQYTAVEHEIATAATEIAKERAAQEAAIARSASETDIAISRMTLEAQKSVLNEELAAHQVNAAQKLATLRDLTSELYAQDLKQLEDYRDSLKSQPAEYAKVCDQIRALKAKLTVDLAALDREGAADAKRAAEQEAQAWKQAVGEIESAEQSMLQNLLTGRKSFSQAAIQAAGQLVDREIEADLRAMTTRMLISNKELAQKEASEQGGVLYHALADEKDTTSTQVAAAQQTIATRQSQQMQTQATIAGGQVRVASTAAAASQGQAAQAALNSKTVMADAAKAFSGTYASVSSIPIVGWILAPVAAAAAFAAVSAYEGLASLDTGAWKISADMPAHLHAGEMVVPAAQAEALRSSAGPRGSFNTLAAGMGAGLGDATSRVIRYSSAVNAGAWGLPPEASPVSQRETGAIPAATMLASGGNSNVERGAAGDTFGATTFNQHFHEVHSADDIVKAVSKAYRNFHPAAMRALRR